MWLRRSIYLVLILLLLLLMLLPLLAFRLAGRQQIQLGNSERDHLRIFLVQEKTAEGIGVEQIRPYQPLPNCFQTDVNYYMWKGEPENTTFCQCYHPDTEELISTTMTACTPFP